MNKNNFLFLITILFVTNNIPTSKSIQCYNCNSRHNQSCSSESAEVLKQFLVDCKTVNNASKYCRKTLEYVFDEWNTVRTCSWEGLPDRERTKSGRCLDSRSPGVVQIWCTCDDRDGCNGVSTIHSSFFVIFVLLLMNKIMSYFNS